MSRAALLFYPPSGGHLLSIAELAAATGHAAASEGALVGMLWAYLDESGTHQGSPVVVVGCYVSTAEQWTRFDTEWATLLKERNLPFFHMTDFVARQGPYTGWSEAERERFIRVAITTIVLRTQYRLAVGLPLEELARTEHFQHLGHPYTLGVIECVKYVGQWMRRYHPSEYVSYVIETGTGHGDEVTRCLNYMRSQPDLRDLHRLGPHTFAEKRSVRQLQASDVLAYECWREATKRRLASNPPARRKTLRALARYKTQFYWYTAERLRPFEREVWGAAPPPRAEPES